MFSMMHSAVGRRCQRLLGAVRWQSTGGENESRVFPAVRSRLAEVHRERTRQALGRQGKPSGSNKLRELNEDLRAVCGDPVMTIGDAVRAFWEYVHAHDLLLWRPPKGIRCDERLKKLSGKDWVRQQDVFKMVSKNSAILEPAPAAGETVHQERTRQALGRQSKPSGSNKLRELNEDLRAVCGDPVMTIGDAVRALWEYVHEHDLLRRRPPQGIRCDERLKKLSGKDSVQINDVFKMVYKNSAILEPAPAAGETGQVGPTDGRPDAGRCASENSAHVRVPHGELAKICGSEPLTFQDAERKLWEHRRSLLTDPDNGLERGQELSCERSDIAQFILENSSRHVK